MDKSGSSIVVAIVLCLCTTPAFGEGRKYLPIGAQPTSLMGRKYIPSLNRNRVVEKTEAHVTNTALPSTLPADDAASLIDSCTQQGRRQERIEGQAILAGHIVKGHEGSDRLVKALLLSATSAGYKEVRRAAIQALAKVVENRPDFAKDVLPTLSKCALSGDYKREQRQEAIQALAKIVENRPEFGKDVLPTLSECALSGDYKKEQRQEAIQALARIAVAAPDMADAAIATLDDCARNGDYKKEQRQAAILALAEIAEKRPALAVKVLPALTHCALKGDYKREQRMTATRALARVAVAAAAVGTDVRAFVTVLGSQAKNGYGKEERISAITAVAASAGNASSAATALAILEKQTTAGYSREERIAAIRALPELLKHHKANAKLFEAIVEVLFQVTNSGHSKEERRAAIATGAALVEADRRSWPHALRFLANQAMNGSTYDEQADGVKALERIVLTAPEAFEAVRPTLEYCKEHGAKDTRTAASRALASCAAVAASYEKPRLDPRDDFDTIGSSETIQ